MKVPISGSPGIMTESADRQRALSLVPVSRETLGRLDQFVDLLIRWQSIKNLVGPKTLNEIWTRHIADSAQLGRYIDDDVISLVDLGSGAGFPGLVLAALYADRPHFQAHLIESNGRKAAFLREAARQMNVPAIIHDKRIEDVKDRLPANIDLVTARALAPLRDLVGFMVGLPAKPRKALFLKGQDIDSELTETAKYWNISYKMGQSLTNPSGRILMISDVRPLDYAGIKST